MRFGRVLPIVAALGTVNPLIARAQQEQPASPALHGAWRIVRTSLTAGDQPQYVAYDQPSLVLFAPRHYSLMYVEGNRGREPFRDPARPTDVEKLAAFDTFAAHSGTYTAADSIIAMQVVVSKSPNLMGTELRESFARFAYEIAGDTLRLTRRTPRGAFSMLLVRAR